MKRPPLPVARFALNAVGRDFCVGDIHGRFDLLQAALDHVRFDANGGDRLFLLGDLIDRGPYSPMAADFLERPGVFSVLGNHEAMVLELYEDGEPIDVALRFAASHNGFGWWLDTDRELRSRLLRAFATLPLAIEIETRRGIVGLIHADVPRGMPWDAFTALLSAMDAPTVDCCLWGRNRLRAGDTQGVAGIDRLYVGHTPQWMGAKRFGNVYALDTGAVFGGDTHPGHLTLLNVAASTQMIGAGPVVNLLDLAAMDVPERAFGVYLT